MKILITGASGFVGQNILSYLNYKCDCPTRDELKEGLDFSFYDVIIHLAGKAHDLKKATNADEYYDVNYKLTKKVYDAFLDSNAKKFIFLSSIKAVADSSEDILTENFNPDPQTHYGKSKLLAENYIISRPLPDNKSYYILRPCMIHGPGNKGNLNLLYNFIKKGIPYPLAGFNNKRSFLSVENLCFAIDEIITREDIVGGVYHVADDEALSTNTVVDILAYSLNAKPKLWKISPVFIKFLAKIGDLLHLPLTTERLNKLTENYVISNNKIKMALNKQLPLTAKNGLKITANSFK